MEEDLARGQSSDGGLLDAPLLGDQPPPSDQPPPPEWRPIVGYPAYEVSSHGHVRRLGQTTHLRGEVSNRYLRVKLRGPDGRNRNRRIHLLVLETFVGPPPAPDWEGAHGAGGMHDNSIGNLRWATRHQNEADKRASGTVRGGGAKTPLPVDLVKKMCLDGYSDSAIAKALGAHRYSVSRIRKGLRGTPSVNA
jgi:hypothetical protein